MGVHGGQGTVVCQLRVCSLLVLILVDQVVATLMRPQRQLVPADPASGYSADQASISRAGYYLEHNQLRKALGELSQLSPLPRELAQSFVEDVERRLTVDLAVDTARTVVTLLAAEQDFDATHSQ